MNKKHVHEFDKFAFFRLFNLLYAYVANKTRQDRLVKPWIYMKDV